MIITTLLNSDLFQCHHNCALFHSAIIVRLSWQVLEIRYPKTWWCPDLFKCRNYVLIGFIRIAYRMISVASPSDDFSTSMVCCLVCTWTWSEPSLASLFKTSPYFCDLLCASSFFSACHDPEIFLSRRPHCGRNNILAPGLSLLTRLSSKGSFSTSTQLCAKMMQLMRKNRLCKVASIHLGVILLWYAEAYMLTQPWNQTTCSKVVGSTSGFSSMVLGTTAFTKALLAKLAARTAQDTSRV